MRAARPSFSDARRCGPRGEGPCRSVRPLFAGPRSLARLPPHERPRGARRFTKQGRAFQAPGTRQVVGLLRLWPLAWPQGQLRPGACALDLENTLSRVWGFSMNGSFGLILFSNDGGQMELSLKRQ